MTSEVKYHARCFIKHMYLDRQVNLALSIMIEMVLYIWHMAHYMASSYRSYYISIAHRGLSGLIEKSRWEQADAFPTGCSYDIVYIHQPCKSGDLIKQAKQCKAIMGLDSGYHNQKVVHYLIQDNLQLPKLCLFYFLIIFVWKYESFQTEAAK